MSVGGSALLGRNDSVAPVGRLLAQDAQPVERALRPHRLAAGPPGPRYAAVPAIACKELVAALAAQDHFYPRLARRLAQPIGRDHRVVGHRIVERRRGGRQGVPEIGLVETELDFWNTLPAAR